MNATPEVFAHLTHFLMQLANGKLCVILEVKTFEMYPRGRVSVLEPFRANKKLGSETPQQNNFLSFF